MGLRLISLAVFLASSGVCRSASTIYLSSESAAEPVLYGRRLRVTPTEPSFSLYATSVGGLSASFQEPGFGGYVVLYFVPPTGGRFAPGSYDGATDCGLSSRPGFCATQGSFYSTPADAHVDVLDAAYDPGGRLRQFSADFSQRGSAGGALLTGSIRFAAGDDTCAGAPDGTPCDDLDACSATSSCSGGYCVAVTSMDCSSSAAGACHDAPACDPAAGTCMPPSTWNDGIRCIPDDQCFLYGSCASGVCVSTEQRYCYDSDPCTYDTCDSHTGCTYPPIPGVCGRPGLPGSFVFLRQTPAAGPGTPLPFLATAEHGLQVGMGSQGGVTASVSAESAGYWSFTFAPPTGQTLRPGVYENAGPFPTSDHPTLSVYGSYVSSCPQPVGRFVVHELATGFAEGGHGGTLAFSADFEEHCGPDAPVWAGAIRFRAGDPGCVGAADGTPCDDLDACTATSTCQGGYCVAGDPVACPPVTDGCHAPALCDPSSGVCLDPAFLSDTLSCDDPSTCTHGGTCHEGTCTLPDPPCDDANPCTVDRCEGGSQCAHDSIPGCWLTAGKITISASASGTFHGHSVECHARRCQRIGGDIMLIPGDGTYWRASGHVMCKDGSSVTLPDEVGLLRPTRSGRLRVHPANQPEILKALRQCQGIRLKLSRREWIMPSANGQELTGLARQNVTLFQQLPIHEVSVSHIHGRLGTAPDPIVLEPNEHLCEEPLRLVCRLR